LQTGDLPFCTGLHSFLKLNVFSERKINSKMLKKCSNISCGSFVNEYREQTEISEIEKKFGLLCNFCASVYKQGIKNIVTAVCAECGHIVYIFKIQKEPASEIYYCEQCRICGDIQKETKLFSAN
jgi:hypothetical protein